MKPRGIRALGRFLASSPTQLLGLAAENCACAFLEREGLEIVERNVRFRAGELDAVARDRDTLVFVEIRRRKRSADAAASIDYAKRGKIRRAAKLYLCARYPDRWPACRFDVVLVDGDGIEWLQSAFAEHEE